MIGEEKSLQDFAHGSAFLEPSVVAAYRHRPVYGPDVFDVLMSLMPPAAPRRALDLGCGPGLLARPLAARIDEVDAVDISPGMLEEGRRAEGGAQTNLRWRLGSAETAPFDPPYGLATAGDSLGWMDWAVVMDRLAHALAPGAVLAILNLRPLPPPWADDLLTLIRRYSTNQAFRPVAVADELAARGAFVPGGRHTSAPTRLIQSIEDYVESFHARAGFAREWMTREDAAAFDDGLRALVRAAGQDQVIVDCVADIAWGRPQARAAFTDRGLRES
jgi:SAM-dependent methyltransferase